MVKEKGRENKKFQCEKAGLTFEVEKSIPQEEKEVREIGCLKDRQGMCGGSVGVLVVGRLHCEGKCYFL